MGCVRFGCLALILPLAGILLWVRKVIVMVPVVPTVREESDTALSVSVPALAKWMVPTLEEG